MLPDVDSVVIADDKLFKHLFVWKAVNDKSGMMARMGFSVHRPDEVRAALMRHAREGELTGRRDTSVGISHEVTGPLHAPSGVWEGMITVWHVATGESEPRFVTLRPK